MTTTALNRAPLVPEGEETLAARARLADLKAQIDDLQGQLQASASRQQVANQREAEATARRTNAESLLRRAALGEEVPRPKPAELATLIEQQAIAEREATSVRDLEQAESHRLQGEVITLSDRLHDFERAISAARFHELVEQYRAAVKPLIPLALELRLAAEATHKPVNLEPLLIDPDHDQGRQLFGVAV